MYQKFSRSLLAHFNSLECFLLPLQFPNFFCSLFFSFYHKIAEKFQTSVCCTLCEVSVCVSSQHNKWQTAAVIVLTDDLLVYIWNMRAAKEGNFFLSNRRVTCVRERGGGQKMKKYGANRQKSVTIHRKTLIFVCVIFTCMRASERGREGSTEWEWRRKTEEREKFLFSFHPTIFIFMRFERLNMTWIKWHTGWERERWWRKICPENEEKFSLLIIKSQSSGTPALHATSSHATSHFITIQLRALEINLFLFSVLSFSLSFLFFLYRIFFSFSLRFFLSRFPLKNDSANKFNSHSLSSAALNYDDNFSRERDGKLNCKRKFRVLVKSFEL